LGFHELVASQIVDEFETTTIEYEQEVDELYGKDLMSKATMLATESILG